MRKASLAAILVCFVVGLVSPVYAETGLTYEIRDAQPTGEGMLADLAFARPVGAAALVLGAAASIVALPFALMTCKTVQGGINWNISNLSRTGKPASPR